jgi:hypothetical protein
MALGGTRGTGGVLRLRATSSRPGEGVKGNPVLAYNYSNPAFSVLCWWASPGFPCREAWAPQTPHWTVECGSVTLLSLVLSIRVMLELLVETTAGY